MKLREAVGEEIGANNDLSHLFWQGCDPVEVIHFLGKQGAIFHAHMKDTVLFPGQCREIRRAEFRLGEAGLAGSFGDVSRRGYGHGAGFVEVRCAGVHGHRIRRHSEHRERRSDSAGPVGVERAVWVLKNVRTELLADD